MEPASWFKGALLLRVRAREGERKEKAGEGRGRKVRGKDGRGTAAPICKFLDLLL